MRWLCRATFLAFYNTVLAFKLSLLCLLFLLLVVPLPSVLRSRAKLTISGSTLLHKPSTISISTHCPNFQVPSCGQPPGCLSYTVSSLESSSGANENFMRSMVRLFVLLRTRSPSQVKRRGMISIHFAVGTSEPREIRPFISVSDPISDTFNPLDCKN